MKSLLRLILLTATLALGACASKPILIPNAKYQRAGQERSEEDINRCMKVADNQLKKTQDRRVVRGLAKGAAIGGVAGGVIGAGSGHLVGGAIGGAAGGAAIGGILGAFETPEAAKKGLVNYCLERKGYRIAGWD